MTNPKKRQRKPTQRFGENSADSNKDHYFQQTDSAVRFSENSADGNKDHHFDLTQNESGSSSVSWCPSSANGSSKDDNTDEDISLEANDLENSILIGVSENPDTHSNDRSNGEVSFVPIDPQKSTSNGISKKADTHSKGRSDGKNLFVVNGSQKSSSNGLEKQVCRIEAKINQIHSTLLQLHRAFISSTIGVNASAGTEQFPELPIATEESMNKFEQDLCEISYHEKVVSMISVLIDYFTNQDFLFFLFFRGPI